MKKQTIILTVVLVVIIGALGWSIFGSDSSSQKSEDSAPVEIVNDPIDVTMELYDPWLAYLQATSTDVSKAELLASFPVTEDLRSKLSQLVNDDALAKDPILCQTVLPERVGPKIVFANDTQTQLSVVARRSDSTEQALVDLVVVGDKWVISNITCSQGEVAPVVEFSFDHEGNLLKQSLQAPLDSSKWHLIYTIDDVPGHAVPLIFDASSTCVAIDGSEQVCSDNQLSEIARVSIKGEMQEAGALVQRLEFK